MSIKYPNITVKLVGENGNAFYIIGKVTKALRRNKVGAAEISEFQTACTSGDYNNLLMTCMQWVNVE